MMCMPTPFTLHLLQGLFAERSSTRKQGSQLQLTAKNHQSQIHWWHWFPRSCMVPANIKTHPSYSSTPQITLTLSQSLTFNIFTCCQDGSSLTLRHRQERETPLPLHLGVLIHSKTRKKELVDTLFELELCIFYDRAMSISTVM